MKSTIKQKPEKITGRVIRKALATLVQASSQRSLPLYQEGIETLIRAVNFMKDSKQNKIDGLHIDVLIGRIKEALSEAEEMKKIQSEDKSVLLVQRSARPSTIVDPFVDSIKRDMYIDSKLIATRWDDISGLFPAKQALQEAAILPFLRPDLYSGLRSPPKGILLYGPPGTGKTMLVKAVAHESNCILFSCTASSVTSKWVGESEKLVRALFQMAADVAPSIIFLDEIDALLGKRKSEGNTEQESSRRLKTEFMVQMDGLAVGSVDRQNKRVLLIGCTNCPWDIDDAIMRRFQRRIYIPLPDSDARMSILIKILQESKEVKISTLELKRLVKLTEGLSGSDIASMANEAAFGPLREIGSIDAIKGVKRSDVRPIQMKDFERVLTSSKRGSVSTDLLKRYHEWECQQTGISS